MGNKIIYNGEEYNGTIVNDSGVGEYTSNEKKKNPTGSNNERFNDYTELTGNRIENNQDYIQNVSVGGSNNEVILKRNSEDSNNYSKGLFVHGSNNSICGSNNSLIVGNQIIVDEVIQSAIFGSHNLRNITIDNSIVGGGNIRVKSEETAYMNGCNIIGYDIELDGGFNYNQISGIGQKITSSSESSISGEGLVLNNVDCSIASGRQNTINSCNYSIISGYKNILSGGTAYSIIAGSNNSSNSSISNSLINGDSNIIGLLQNSYLNGNSNSITTELYYGVIIGNSNTLADGNSIKIYGNGNQIGNMIFGIVDGNSNSINTNANSGKSYVYIKGQNNTITNAVGSEHFYITGKNNTADLGASYIFITGENNTATTGSTRVYITGSDNNIGSSYTNVEGRSNVTSSGSSDNHIEGLGNSVGGGVNGSHIEGLYNIVNGGATYNHVEGRSNRISPPAQYAHVQGVGNKSCSPYETVLGRCCDNNIPGIYAVVIGNGTMTSSGINKYNSSATYVSGDRIIYNEKVYTCLAETSGDFDLTKWSLDSGIEIVEEDKVVDTRSNAATLTWDGQLNVAGGYKVNGQSININADEANPNISDAYSSSSTYNIGDYCIYNNILYRCNTAISVAEDFDSSKWTQTTIGAELLTMINRITALETALNGYSFSDN